MIRLYLKKLKAACVLLSAFSVLVAQTPKQDSVLRQLNQYQDSTNNYFFKDKTKARFFINQTLIIAERNKLWEWYYDAMNDKASFHIQYNEMPEMYEHLRAFEDFLQMHKADFDKRKYQILRHKFDIASVRYYSNIGDLYSVQKVLPTTIALYSQIPNLEADDYKQLYSAIISLASSYRQEGKYEAAIQNYVKSFVFKDKYRDTKAPPQYALTFGHIASVYLAMKNYEKASEYWLKAVTDVEQSLRYEKKITGIEITAKNTYLRTASLYLQLNRIDDALNYIQKSKKLSDPSGQFTHDEYLLEAQCALKKGQNDEAKQKLAAAIEVRKQATSGKQRMELAQLYLEKAKMSRIFGQEQEALQDCQDALVALSRTFRDSSYKADPSVSDVFSKKDLLSITKLKADLLLALSQTQPTNDYGKMAFILTQKGIAHIDSIRLDFTADFDKQFLLETGLPIFEKHIFAANQLYRETANIDYSKSAFQAAEQSKALVLFEALRTAQAENTLSVADRTRFFQLRTDLNRLEKSINDLKNTAPNNTRLQTVQTAALEKRQAYEALIQSFITRYPAFYKAKYGIKTMSVAEVQTLLQPKQTLLEYFAGDSTITIFVIRADKYEVVTVKNNFALDSLVRQMRTSLTTDRITGARRYSETALLLYQKLVAPVKALLTEDVIIIPDGVLSYIPFEALLVEQPKEVVRFKTHHYLLRDHRISYCFSATLLREMMQKQHATPPTLPIIALAPFFEGDTIQLSALFSNDSDIAAERDAMTLVPLKYTGEEAYKVAQLLKGEAIVGKAATQARFTEGVSKARILHLATHAKADDRSGDYSYLVFAPQKDSTQNDLLYVRDLYNCRLNADLVVLSACETGVGKLQRGEGVISLARAFAYSGAKAIVTSIWSVNDAKTKDLMVLFYQNLKRGQPKNEALRQAKLTYLNTHTAEDCHPYFWSGFISIGEQTAIK